MPPEETELTFIRCPSCRSLVPAVATRCRMCGQLIEQGASQEPSSGSSSGSLDALNRKSRVRQRTTSVSESERESAKDTAIDAPFDAQPDVAVEFETRRPQEASPRAEAAARDTTPPPPPASDLPFRLGRKSDEQIPVGTPSPTPVTPQATEPADNWLRNMNAELESHSDAAFSDDDGDFDESDEGFDDEGEDESENVISFRGLKSDGESGDERGGDLQAGMSQAPTGDRKKRRRRRKRRRGGERSEQPGVSGEAVSHAQSRAPVLSSGPSSVTASGVHRERHAGGYSSAPAMENFRQEPPQETRQNVSEREPRVSAPSAPRFEQPAEAERLHTQPEVDGQLIGWFVNFSGDPRGSATEIRAGRFFISGEQLRPSDTVFRHESVSTPHCLVRASSSHGIQLQDLMSERGTLVRKRGDGEFRRFQEVMTLESGDVVRFGECEVTICLIPYGKKR